MTYIHYPFIGIDELKFGMDRNTAKLTAEKLRYTLVNHLDDRAVGVELQFDKGDRLQGVVLHNPAALKIGSVVYSLPIDIDKIVSLDDSHHYYHIGTEIFPRIGLAMRDYTKDSETLLILSYCSGYFGKSA